MCEGMKVYLYLPWLRHQIEMNGQLHVLGRFILGEEHSLLIA
jgi:hypothetical protein